MKGIHHKASFLIDSVDAWKQTHPHVILFCLLPPLLFEDASSMDYYTFRKVLSASVCLAGPGVFISMFLTAAASLLIFGFDHTCGVNPRSLAHTIA